MKAELQAAMLHVASLKKEKRVRHLGREQNADFERQSFEKLLSFSYLAQCVQRFQRL